MDKFTTPGHVAKLALSGHAGKAIFSDNKIG